MKALVISHTHLLLPLCWRLQQEGNEVNLIIDRDAYEKRAWRGKFKSNLSGWDKRRRQDMHGQRRQAEEAGVTVITDDPRWAKVFDGYPDLFALVERPEGAPPLPFQQLGAWFDGEQFSGRHIIIEDRGLWPGGMGPSVVGGLTLISPYRWLEGFENALERVKDELKAKSYRGLIKVGAVWKPRGETQPGELPEFDPVVVGYEAGWNWLQTHAILAEAGDQGTPTITQILEGAEPAFCHRFTVTIPVSVPPYPHRAAAAEASAIMPIPEGAVNCGYVFWHDMMIEEGVVKTAGLDGLVGVVRASADNLTLARAQALNRAKLFQLPELQVRVDVGAQVDRWLAEIEEIGYPV